MKRALIAAALVLCASACATSTIDMSEPRRVVGTEDSVRVDAEISGDEVQNGAHVPITYTISNQRPTAIGIADLVPSTVYDPDTQMFTVDIGSEVPGMTLVPRLIIIASGEKKTFSTMARVVFALPRSTDAHQVSPHTDLRLRVNFLGDTSGEFQQLVGIPERSIADPKLAEALFPLWVERNEVVYTNAVPMRWRGTNEPVEQPPPVRKPRPN